MTEETRSPMREMTEVMQIASKEALLEAERLSVGSELNETFRRMLADRGIGPEGKWFGKRAEAAWGLDR